MRRSPQEWGEVLRLGGAAGGLGSGWGGAEPRVGGRSREWVAQFYGDIIDLLLLLLLGRFSRVRLCATP